MGGSAGDEYDFENVYHPSVLEGDVRRYEAAVKQAVAANTTTAAEGLPSWSHVFHFDYEVFGWTFKPVPEVGYEVFQAGKADEDQVFEADQDQVVEAEEDRVFEADQG